MSAYAIFLGPIAAIMLFDFWVVNRAKYDCLALYQPLNPIYRYVCTVPFMSGKTIWGVNWRALVSFIVGVVPSLPGLINAVNPKVDVGEGVHPYQFGWLLGFSATAVVYLALSWLFPVKETQIPRAVFPDEIYDERAVVVEGLETDSSEHMSATSQGEKMAAESGKVV
jgi:cytosine/uracil/thiamine/allantoin permease